MLKQPHQLGCAPAQHGLLAEKIRFCFLAKGGLDAARRKTADQGGVRQRLLPRASARVLMHGEKTWHAAPALKFASHEIAGSFRGHHDDIDISRRLDATIQDSESVCE